MWIAADIGLRRSHPVTSQVTCDRLRSYAVGTRADELDLHPRIAARRTGVASDAGLDLLDPRSGQVTRRFALETASGERLRPSAFPATLFEDQSAFVWVGLFVRADLASVDPASGILQPRTRSTDRPAERIIPACCRSSRMIGALWHRHQRTRPLATGSDRKQAVWLRERLQDPINWAGISWSGCPTTTRAVSGLTRSAETSIVSSPTAVPVYRNQAGNARSLIHDFVISA